MGGDIRGIASLNNLCKNVLKNRDQTGSGIDHEHSYDPIDHVLTMSTWHTQRSLD